ncbi:MAG: hypothetical protein IJT16_14405 [Lachnospiraceae bacterium]|nr:hypothetical protein [Lachnospiraceae bacterium]
MDSTSGNKKYTIDELHTGMKVKESQLDNIFKKHIILINSYLNSNGEIEGIIGFIGNQLNEESDRLNQKGVIVTHIYNEEVDKEGEVYYDE